MSNIKVPKIITEIGHHAASLGKEESKINKNLKSFVYPIENTVKETAEKFAKADITKNTPFFEKLWKTPLKWASKGWLKLSSKVPFIGAAILVLSCIVPGLYNTGSSLLKGDLEGASKHFARMTINTLCAFTLGAGLARSGIIASSVGAAGGAWIGNKISDTVLGKDNNQPGLRGINKSKTSQEDEFIPGAFPMPVGGVTDEGFEQMIRYVDRVANF